MCAQGVIPVQAMSRSPDRVGHRSGLPREGDRCRSNRAEFRRKVKPLTDRPRVYGLQITGPEGHRALNPTLGTAAFRLKAYGILVIATRVLAAVAGVVGGLTAKMSADHVISAVPAPRLLPVLVYSSSVFPGKPIDPGYAGLWIGVIIVTAVLGVIFVTAGLVVASTKPCVARDRDETARRRADPSEPCACPQRQR